MRIIQRGRCGGKTYLLMETLADNPNDAVIVHSTMEANRLKEDYPTLADRIFPVSNASRGILRGRRFDRVHVDNLDLILPYLLGTGPVGLVTMTPEEGVA